MNTVSPRCKSHSMLRRAAVAGLLAGAGVLLSAVSIPVGAAKVFPFQHTINVICGVLLGPWWAVGAAFITSLIRNIMGTGSPFAFPGSMFGAFLDGLIAMHLHGKNRLWAALGEPVGTGIIGAWCCAALVGPSLGKNFAFTFWSASFMASCIPGAALGVAILYILRTKVNPDNL